LLHLLKRKLKETLNGYRGVTV